MEISRLTRDGTAEPVQRDQILRRERGQGNAHFPCSADVFDEPFCSLDSVAHFGTVSAELGTSVRIVS